VGLGSLAVTLGALALYALLGIAGSSGCYSSRPDEDVEAGVCLSAVREDGGEFREVLMCLSAPYEDGSDAGDDLGVCLGPLPDDTWEPPDAHVCLSEAAVDVRPPDVVDAGPCLDPPPPDAREAGDGLPLCPPELCDVCLEEPIDWCILDCPPRDAGKSARNDPAGALREHLASRGVLTAEQVARLRRLRGLG
jgi:hypothetical protein